METIIAILDQERFMSCILACYSSLILIALIKIETTFHNNSTLKFPFSLNLFPKERSKSAFKLCKHAKFARFVNFSVYR